MIVWQNYAAGAEPKLIKQIPVPAGSYIWWFLASTPTMALMIGFA